MSEPLSSAQRLILTTGLAAPEPAAGGGEPALDIELVDWATTHRVTGLLSAALREGRLVATPALAQDLADRHALAMASDLVLEQALLATVATLRSAGVEPWVLKGAAVAHLDYPDPSWRSFADVDVMVSADDYDRAAGALRGAGHRRVYPEPRPGFDRRFGKGTVFEAAGGYEIDLHRSMASGPFGVLLDLDALQADAESFTLATTALRALSPPGRALQAAFQVALDAKARRVSASRDLAGMLLRPGFDPDTLSRLTIRCRASAVLARAIEVAQGELGVSLPGFSLPAPRRREQRWLAMSADPSTSYAARSVAAVTALPRLRDKIAMASALAVPRGGYVQGRHDSRSRRLRRNVGTMLRALRR